MSRSVAASTIITRATRRADVESATLRYPPAELLDEANESLAAWYRFMVQVKGHDYWAKTTTVTTAAGTATYTITPTDFWELLAIDLTLSDGTYRALQPFDLSERAALLSGGLTGDALNLRYRLYGQTSPVTASGGTVAADKIEFAPLPTAAWTVTLRYLPSPPTFPTSAATLEGIAGFEEFLVLDMARKIARKEGDQALAASIIADLSELKADIRVLAPRRDAANPASWVDMRRKGGRWR